MKTKNSNDNSKSSSSFPLFSFLFLVYFLIGSVLPRLFPEFKILGPNHDLISYFERNKLEDYVKDYKKSEDEIKRDLIGDSMVKVFNPLTGKGDKWYFENLNEFEEFIIKDVEFKGNLIRGHNKEKCCEQIYTIHAILRGTKNRYKSQFKVMYVFTDNNKNPNKPERINPITYERLDHNTTDIITENEDNQKPKEERKSRKIVCPNCNGSRIEMKNCEYCDMDYNCRWTKGGGYKFTSGDGGNNNNCSACRECNTTRKVEITCRVCFGEGRIDEYE